MICALAFDLVLFCHIGVDSLFEYLGTKQHISMFVFIICLFPVDTLGHGSLVEPPSRAAMNKYGFPENPVDNDYVQGFCGGFSYQHSSEIGGR